MRKQPVIYTVVVWMVFSCLPGFACPGVLGQEKEDAIYAADTESDYIVKVAKNAAVNWTTKVIRVTGTGFGPENIRSLGRRKILARRAARVDAYRTMLEVIKGVRVTGSTTVEEMMIASDSVWAKTHGMLKGMKAISIRYTKDGGCEMVMEVNIDKDGQFLLTALNTGEVRVDDNYPRFDWVKLRNDLDQTKKQLDNARASLSRKRKQLADASRTMAQLESRLKNSIDREARMKYTLVAAVRELEKTRQIAADLKLYLNNQTIKKAVAEKEVKLLNKFLQEKQYQLNQVSNELGMYKNRASQSQMDYERMMQYIALIKKIQGEMGQKIPQPISGPQVNYTGILIDARDLALKASQTPGIWSKDMKPLYGPKSMLETDHTINPKVIYDRGSMDHAKNRKKIKDTPLVINAVGTRNGSDIIISNEDALIFETLDHLTSKHKIVILSKLNQ